MSTVNIPKDYNRVMPYLILKDPGQFFEFTKQVFNATEKMRHVHESNGLVHGEILIGDSCIMFGGSGEQWEQMPAGLFVYVENADETFQKALDAGGTVVMGLSDQEYGRTCGVKDPTGNTWWITSINK